MNYQRTSVRFQISVRVEVDDRDHADGVPVRSNWFRHVEPTFLIHTSENRERSFGEFRTVLRLRELLLLCSWFSVETVCSKKRKKNRSMPIPARYHHGPRETKFAWLWNSSQDGDYQSHRSDRQRIPGEEISDVGESHSYVGTRCENQPKLEMNLLSKGIDDALNEQTSGQCSARSYFAEISNSS